MSKLNGKWKTLIKTPRGDMTGVADFAVKGDTFKGKIKDSSGDVAKMEKGKLDGDNFSFEITVLTGVGELVCVLSGVVNDEDKIVGTSKNAMGEFEFTAIRA